MSFRRVLFAGFGSTFLLIGACATPPIEVQNLTAVENPTSFRLPEKISYTAQAGSGTYEQGLLPGEYVAYKENSLGVFFRGPRPTFWLKYSNEKNTLLHDGGIWFPKDPNGKPRIYTDLSGGGYTADSVDIVVNSAQQPQPTQARAYGSAVGGALGGAIVTTLANASEGEMGFTPAFSDADFIAKIRAAESTKAESPVAGK